MALLEYKCPCCAGKLEFDGTIGKVKCPFCDTEFDVSTFSQLDEELNQVADENMEWKSESTDTWGEDAEGMAYYTCQSCGAQIVMDETTAASKCPYCDNPIVMMGNVKGDLKPDLIIPFKLDKKAAEEAFAKHLGDKKLLPRAFKDQKHIKEIKGVYVPYWIYNSKANASVQYKATKVNHRVEGDYDVTETEYYSVFRNGYMEYENVPVDGASKMDNALMDSVEPFDFSAAVPFQTAYMAGYAADRYDEDSEKCAERANTRIKNSTANAFASTVGNYTTVEVESQNIGLTNGSAKYALLPLWILNTKWNDENYIFAMNGQTGKFVGNLPCDKSLYKKYAFGTGAVVAAVIFAVAMLIQLL